jgi:hypothetical protein
LSFKAFRQRPRISTDFVRRDHAPVFDVEHISSGFVSVDENRGKFALFGGREETRAVARKKQWNFVGFA